MKMLVDAQELMDEVQKMFVDAVDSEVMYCLHGALTTRIHILPKTILVYCKECRFRSCDECLLTGDKVIADGYCDKGCEFDDDKYPDPDLN